MQTAGRTGGAVGALFLQPGQRPIPKPGKNLLRMESECFNIQEKHDSKRSVRFFMNESLKHFPCRLLVFRVENRNYALDISFVQRVVPMVEITTLPGSPSVVAGVVNIRGGIVPVVSLRLCCGLPERGLKLSDRLIVLQLERRMAALWVDDVLGLQECNEGQWTAAEEITRSLKSVEGIVKNGEELLIFQNPESYLSPKDHDLLDLELLQFS
ncbi:MAG: Chemotaxis protein CheW [Syntrophus sp. PtaU1.Bin005]|nr:MAG: Chemotaxis protein CheW [Syntrophus sp. PtaU1.Bin005]